MGNSVMPLVIEVQPKPHAEWDVEGTVLTVGTGDESLEIDLAERQCDDETIIDICRCPDGVKEGVSGSYVLSVKIPPSRYREEAAEPGNGSDFESGTLVAEPLDMASVELLLWTVETNSTDEEV